MYTQSKIGILGNIFSGWSVNALEVDCPMYGWCNPCDDGHFQKRVIDLRRPALTGRNLLNFNETDLHPTRWQSAGGGGEQYAGLDRFGRVVG